MQAEDRAAFDEKRARFFGVDSVEYRMCALDRDREDLNERIESRVEAMFEAGLVNEVAALCERARPHLRPAGREIYRLGPQADKALGYKEALAYLNGATSLETTVELTKRHTRQFATKQMTWFRNFPRMRHVAVNSFDDAHTIAQAAAESLAGEI